MLNSGFVGGIGAFPRLGIWMGMSVSAFDRSHPLYVCQQVRICRKKHAILRAVLAGVVSTF